MVKTPTWIEKQKLLYPRDGKIEKNKLAHWFHACFEAGNLQDALEYAIAWGDAASIEAIKRKAIDVGDAFLLHQLRLGKYDVSDQEWIAAKANAQSRGLGLFSAFCDESLKSATYVQE
ncbi:MAG: hypothetical protein KDD52_02050 [Bdellovibrionales bacterium]|nr:hypothetical protein [Bdellovibrionales bacterium]